MMFKDMSASSALELNQKVHLVRKYGGKTGHLAYDPDRNMYYIPVIESCALHVNVPTEKSVAREFWLGGGPKMGPIITGSVTAMDVNL